MIFEFNIGFLKISILDVIEILLIAYILFVIYKLIRGSIAVKVLIGFLFIHFFYLIVKSANMNLLTMVLDGFMNIGFLTIIIVFQQEIRKFLFLIGGTTFNRDYILQKIRWFNKKNITNIEINPILEAVKILGGSNTGALIILSKTDDLKFYEDSGDIINAKISKRLLLSIFNKNSPLHDGGVIIRDDKIIAARCVLPVSENRNIPEKFGLRHRAALGISEITSSLVIVVSEETGQIALAEKGSLKSNLSIQEARSVLKDYFKIEDKIL